MINEELEWNFNIQELADMVDSLLLEGGEVEPTLEVLAERLGYSSFYTSRKFREVAGTTLKDYIRKRRLSFALKDLRDTEDSIMTIAVRYGFSSGEAFSRSFREHFCVSPSEYRRHPVPVVLRTLIRPYDCYLMENSIMENKETKEEIKTYFIRIPAHRFLHIRNYRSIGYWDFWEKQSHIPGQDCETICGLLSSMKGILDSDMGGEMPGQLMAWINEPSGRLCSWGIPLAEAYGVRLPADYDGPIPENMEIMDVPEGDYIVFEHGPFDYEKDTVGVEAQIEKAMKEFDYGSTDYELDLTQGRVFYFYMDPSRFWKYVRPVVKK